jgi:hypothetical protein
MKPANSEKAGSDTRKLQGDEHVTTVGTYAVCSGHLIDGECGLWSPVISPEIAQPFNFKAG